MQEISRSLTAQESFNFAMGAVFTQVLSVGLKPPLKPENGFLCLGLVFWGGFLASQLHCGD